MRSYGKASVRLLNRDPVMGKCVYVIISTFCQCFWVFTRPFVTCNVTQEHVPELYDGILAASTGQCLWVKCWLHTGICCGQKSWNRVYLIWCNHKGIVVGNLLSLFTDSLYRCALYLHITQGCSLLYMLTIIKHFRGFRKVHDDVIKWKHFPLNWSFVLGIHQSPVYSRHKGQWRGSLMFSLICAWINGWVDNDAAGDLRRHRAHFDVTVMWTVHCGQLISSKTG